MSNFDINIARKAADFSVLAYKENDKFIVPEGYVLLNEIKDKKTDTRALFLRAGNQLILTFRGTASFKNVITDIRISKIKYPSRRLFFRKYKSHKGFSNAYLSIRDQLIKDYKKYIQKGDKILMTGHSLGGALATIAALDFKRTLKYRKPELAVYTFGSPKVGNDDFVRVYNKKVKNSYRIVNDEDIVPQSPPGFEHVNNYVLIDEGKTIIVKPGFFEKLEKRFEGAGGVLTGKALKAHSSDGYREFMYNLPISKK